MARPVSPSRSDALLTALPLHENRRTRTAFPAAIVLAALVTIYWALFGWLSLDNYHAYTPHALDLGNMGQATWNTLHGHPYFFTNMRLPYAIEAWRTTTRLSFHVEALFPVISLVFLIYPGPESLLVLQTAGLGAGAVPVYLLARDYLHNRAVALLFAAVYLFFPALQALNLYEFHPVSLATPLLLFGFWFASRRRAVPFAVCALAAIGTKEQIGLDVALFGLYAAWKFELRRTGLGLAFFGFVWSLFAALVVEHHFRQPGTVTYLHSRYGYLGHGVKGALTTVLRHPGTVSAVVLTGMKLRYLVRLLAPVAFLPVLSPETVVLGLPTLAINVLSNEPHMYSALGDNSAELIAVMMISAILGASRAGGWLAPWVSRRAGLTVVSVWTAVIAIWTQEIIGFLPGAANFQVPSVSAHDKLADRFVAQIPSGVPISTQDQLDPHLSSRHYLYLFPDTGRIPPLVPANRILLDASAPTYPLPSYQLYNEARRWIARPGWGIAGARDGLILIERGMSRKSPPAAFYTFMHPGGSRPAHRLTGSENGVSLLGYTVDRSDLANQYPATLNFRFYLRLRAPLHRNLEPVVFARMGGKTIACAAQPLGLAWLPSSRWRPGTTYLVRMDPMQIGWQTFGTARLYVSLAPSPVDPPGTPANSCPSLFARHGRLWRVGTVTLGF